MSNVFSRLFQPGAVEAQDDPSNGLPAFMPSDSAQLVQQPSVAGNRGGSAVLPSRRLRQPVQPQSPARRLFVSIEDHYTIQASFNHSELVVSWGAEFPDKLKIRKELRAWPLRFKLRADYCRASRTFEYGCSCKDALLGGRVRLDIPAQEIEYRKRLAMGGGHLGLTARASYAGLLSARPQVNPTFALAWEFGGGAAIWAGHQFDLRHKLRLSRGLAIEVVGDAQLPQPAARYSWSGNEASPAVHVGEGAFHVHVAQVNAVVNL